MHIVYTPMVPIEDTPELPPPQKHVIHFYGEINAHSVHRLREAAMRALKTPASEICFAFSSYGGDIGAGFALYNFLRGLPVPITMVNMSIIESAAVPVYLAADTRLAAPQSRFLLHSFTAHFYDTNIDAPRLTERSQAIECLAETYKNIFKTRTRNAAKKVPIDKALRGEAVIVQSDGAVAAGLAHTVVAPEGLFSTDDEHVFVEP